MVWGMDVVARSDDFERRANGVELRGWQWQLLHALDGQTEVRDLAMDAGVAGDVATAFLMEAEAAGLVVVPSMTLADYRLLHAIPSHDDAMSSDEDHLSAIDTLASYESTVPEWMVDHHAGDASHDEAAAEYHHDEPVVAEYHHDEPVVAEHHDEPVVAEHHDEPVVAEHHDEPVVAEHHDEPVVAEQPVAFMLSFDPMDAASQAGPAYHHETPVDAAKSVAALVAGHPPAALADEEPVAAAEAEPEPSPSGHAAPFSWEPMSLVTTVDPEPAGFEAAVDEPLAPHAEHTAEMPDGVSIWLAPHGDAAPEPQAEQPVAAAPPPVETPERGSISFSFSADDGPLGFDAPIAPVSTAAAPRSAVPAATPQAAPVPPASVPAPPVFDRPGAPAAKNDLVSNLIAKAFTFRLK